MTPVHKRRTGVDRIAHALVYSLQGLLAAWRHESAFRQEALLAAILLPASWWLGQGWIEVALLAGSVVLVLIAELLNSAIEALTDRVSLEMNELSKRAKDMGSAAVFLALMACAGIWAAAGYQRFLA